MDFSKAVKRIMNGAMMKRIDADGIHIYLKRGEVGFAYGFTATARQKPDWTQDPAEILLEDIDATDWRTVMKGSVSGECTAGQTLEFEEGS